MKSEELAALYPNLPPEELRVAEENLKQYLLLAWEIWEMKEKRSQPITQAFDDANPRS